MNKTQVELISRIVNLKDSNIKKGWSRTGRTLRLQKLNEGDQAHKLAEKYPSLFKSAQLAWKLVTLELIGDENKAMELIKGLEQ
jgi:hypothetical protein